MRLVKSSVPWVVALSTCFSIGCGGAKWQPKGSTTAVVRAPAAPTHAPTTHVLAIGISKYLNPLAGRERTELRHADDDAEQIDRFFASPAAGSVPLRQRHKLLNEHATREAIIRELNQIAADSTASDTVVVYFSGHSIKYQATLYFCTYDTDDSVLQDKALKYSDLRGILGQRQLLLIADSCYAGALRTDDVGTNVTILTAADENELAEQHQDIGGLFTHYLLLGLADSREDLDNDGKINAGEIQQYLAREVPRHKGDIVQNPKLLGDPALAIALVRKPEAVPTPTVEIPSTAAAGRATQTILPPVIFPADVRPPKDPTSPVVQTTGPTWAAISPFVPSLIAFGVSATGMLAGLTLSYGISDPRNAPQKAKLIGGTWAAFGFGSIALVVGLALLPGKFSSRSVSRRGPPVLGSAAVLVWPGWGGAP